MSLKPYYSIFRLTKELNACMLSLYLQEAPVLLKKIRDLSESPEIRVGLSIKILHNTPSGTRLPLEVIEPIIRDIETMIKDHDYLRSTGHPQLRLRCLRKELTLIQQYVDLDDTISLNCGESEMTFVDSQMDPKDQGLPESGNSSDLRLCGPSDPAQNPQKLEISDEKDDECAIM